MAKSPKNAAKVTVRTQISVDSEPAVLSFDDVEEHDEMDRREVFGRNEALSLGNGGYRTIPHSID